MPNVGRAKETAVVAARSLHAAIAFFSSTLPFLVAKDLHLMYVSSFHFDVERKFHLVQNSVRTKITNFAVVTHHLKESLYLRRILLGFRHLFKNGTNGTQHYQKQG